MAKIPNNELDEESQLPHKSKTDPLADRKSKRHCPVCKSKLKKISKGTRFEYQCSNCKAMLKKEIKCKYCGTFRVWSGPKGTYCHGCGKENE